MAAGVPITGLCWYPILGHVGWDNERYCPNGLLELNSASGERSVYAPLAAELRTQQAQCAAIEEEELLELHVG